ncbi:hypothetical protein [Vibrio phage 27Ua.3]|nr:hypothetical protein [Vibrio phage 27Ua.3]
MKRKYFDEALPSFFVFGEHANGTVDLSCGEFDVVTYCPTEMAEAAIAYYDSLLLKLHEWVVDQEKPSEALDKLCDAFQDVHAGHHYIGDFGAVMLLKLLWETYTKIATIVHPRFLRSVYGVEWTPSLVQANLLTQRGYTPYCGGRDCKSVPRTAFREEQFRCPSCGWESNFDPEFIAGYKYVWDLPGVDCEMLDEFRAILPLSLHFVMVDADMRYAGRIDDE